MRRLAIHPALRQVAVAIVLLASLSFFAASRPGGHPHDHDHDAKSHHRFNDADRWAAVFDAPERDEWQKPREVVDFLALSEGQVVADLGAGTGYFTGHLAREVGSTGKVYAVDIEPELIDYIRERAERAGLEQVIPVLAEPDDPRLPSRGVDLVFVCNTWHHIDGRLEYLDRLARVLRPGGRVAVVDFKEGELPVGPPPDEKLSRAAVLAEFEEAGWKTSAENEVLPYQFVLVFTPPE